MAVATLQAIRDKVRRLTRSPSINQLTDAVIDENVNTFIAYDFPETLRLFSLNQSVTFTLEPNIDTYTIDSVLGDINLFTTFSPPVYIAGFKVFYSQSEEEFFNVYPFNSSIQDSGLTGDGATLTFAGTVPGGNAPLLRGQVLFASKAADNDGLVLRDVDSDGLLSGDGTGTIDYLTGAFTLDFTTAPAAAEPIVSQTVPYVAQRPTAILYFQNQFVFRPVPDKVYQVQIETFVQPTQLLAAGSEPNLEQWWQYIAYGASKKIFEDRTDMESVAMIMPEFNRQENMVLRRTIVQQTTERTESIYVETASIGAGYNNWNGGPS